MNTERKIDSTSTRRARAGVLTSFVCLGAIALLIGCATARRQADGRMASSATSPEGRLAALKIELSPPSKMPTTIRGLVRVDNLAFVSGHISRRPDSALITGRVGEDLDVTAGKVAARQCGLAILSTLRAELGSLNRVKRVVKVLGMVNCPPGFKEQPAVIDGCSQLFIDVFGQERGTGARSAVGLSALPSHAAVEVEAIFELQP